VAELVDKPDSVDRTFVRGQSFL